MLLFCELNSPSFCYPDISQDDNLWARRGQLRMQLTEVGEHSILDIEPQGVAEGGP